MKFFEDKEIKKMVYIFITITLISALVFVVLFLWYNNQLAQDEELSILNMSYLNNTSSNTTSENLTEVSFSEDKNIKNSVSNTNNNVNKIAVNINTDNTNKDTSNKTDNTQKSNSLNEEEFEGQEIEIEEYILEFEAPIVGEIMKDFAEDSLVYSKTLDEWTVHLGIDIRAEKTSIVKASERGTIENIKNDPRYGLTIIISHEDGYKTMYSNLLSTEFVAIGDTVEKGQGIGTVGDSASFEFADDAHLHFEMYKDGKQVNPTLYFK